MSNIETKIDDISSLSQSQRDRLIFKDQVFDDLIKFLQAHIRKITAKDELREKVEAALMDRINPDDTQTEALTNFALLKLLEILSRNEVDSTTALIRAISESSKNVQQKDNDSKPAQTESDKGKNITQKDIETAMKVSKRLDEFFDELKRTETVKDEQ
jgi:hypothetical protein